MKNFDPNYNDIPKTEIHIHLEGSIRTQTIIDIAREYNLSLPAYEASELDRHVKIYDQMRDLHTVLEAFAIFQNSVTSLEVVERIAWELMPNAERIQWASINYQADQMKNVVSHIRRGYEHILKRNSDLAANAFSDFAYAHKEVAIKSILQLHEQNAINQV